MSLWSLGTATVLRHASPAHISLDVTSPHAPTSAVSTALASLAKYIPAETTTAFLAALGLMPVVGLEPIGNVRWEWLTYGLFAILTPVYVYLGARAAWKASTVAVPNFSAPSWRMAAATVAFAIWALAVPGMLHHERATALAGFAAIFISPLIVMVEKAFGLDK